MSEDAELLRQHVADHSESAFAELIRRHADLVYSAALRLAGGDVHRAQDVTQQVFSELAHQANRLTKHPTLVGWLYTTTRQMAWRVNRTEHRRQVREQEAHTMNELLRESAPPPDWDRFQPVLEDAMHELNEKDRLAVLLRYFQNQGLKEVGTALGLTENAARMRVDRALDKLRTQLARRGVTSTGAALALTLTGNAVTAAPPAFVATLAATSLAGVAGTGTTLTLLKLMAMMKLKTGLIGTVLVVGLVAPLLIQRGTLNELRQENAGLLQQQNELDRLREENVQLHHLPMDRDELDRLRKEHEELLRLRGEIGVLRRQIVDNSKLKTAPVKQPVTPQEEAVDPEQEAFKNLGIAKMNWARTWGLAFQSYASQNGGTMPTSFAQAVEFLPKDRDPLPVTFNPDDWEIMFQGSLKDLKEPSQTIILREMQPFDAFRRPGKSRSYLFADGHSEIHYAADGVFDAWERQHLQPAIQP